MTSSKWLVFTSAGDRTDFWNYWLEKERRFDLCVCYYGNLPDQPYKRFADFYYERKGSKFQNFSWLWDTECWIRDYDHYFILDDDVLIYTDEIHKIFQLQEEHGLWLSQPAYSRYVMGRVSHEITMQRTGTILRYTNFVEVTAMMFSREALHRCMAAYDPNLVGYGIDWLFLWELMKGDWEKRIAIIDLAPCVNPLEDTRSIDELEPLEKRINCWERIRQERGIPYWDHRTLGVVTGRDRD